jgi:hypothetical protein
MVQLFALVVQLSRSRPAGSLVRRSVRARRPPGAPEPFPGPESHVRTQCAHPKTGTLAPESGVVSEMWDSSFPRLDVEGSCCGPGIRHVHGAPQWRRATSPMVHGCGHVPYRSGGADLNGSPRRLWRARCPPGRLSRSPGGRALPDQSWVATREGVSPQTQARLSEWGLSSPARCCGRPARPDFNR